jgi:hypothetical protein
VLPCDRAAGDAKRGVLLSRLLCQEMDVESRRAGRRAWRLEQVPDGACEAALEAADGFAVGCAFGAFALEAGLGLGVAAGAGDATRWMAVLIWRLPPRSRRWRLVLRSLLPRRMLTCRSATPRGDCLTLMAYANLDVGSAPGRRTDTTHRNRKRHASRGHKLTSAAAPWRVTFGTTLGGRTWGRRAGSPIERGLKVGRGLTPAKRRKRRPPLDEIGMGVTGWGNRPKWTAGVIAAIAATAATVLALKHKPDAIDKATISHLEVTPNVPLSEYKVRVGCDHATASTARKAPGMAASRLAEILVVRLVGARSGLDDAAQVGTSDTGTTGHRYDGHRHDRHRHDRDRN